MTLPQLVNQNSYVVAALFFFTIILIMAWRVRQKTLRLALILGGALILIALNFVFRVGVSEIQATTQFDEILAAHQPLVLEIYSNY
jgi:flagellar biosynthesis protein FliQ